MSLVLENEELKARLGKADSALASVQAEFDSFKLQYAAPSQTQVREGDEPQLNNDALALIDDNDNGTRRTWKGALLIGAIGAFVLTSYSIAAVPSNSKEYTVVVAVLVTVFSFVFTLLGYFCLPPNHEIRSANCRGLMEGLLVAGWLGSVPGVLTNFEAEWMVFCGPATLLPLCPIWTALLCWNNIDTGVLQLIRQTLHFKIDVGLTVYIIAMHAWWSVETNQLPNMLSALFRSIVTWSPLAIILAVDSIKRQSTQFRVALPAAFLAYIMAQYYNYAFGGRSTTLIPIFNASWSGLTGSTFEGQISGAVSTLGFLMLTFLWNAIRDTTGTAILFPIKGAVVMKNTVPAILAGGLWSTALDEGRPLVVVLRGSSIIAGAARPRLTLRSSSEATSDPQGFLEEPLL